MFPMSVSLVGSQGHTVPYLTVAELKASPIYNQLQKMVPGSSDASRDAELLRVIIRVSSLINGYVRQNLDATIDTEIARVRVASNGDLRLHTRGSPISQVLSIAIGSDPSNLTPIDLTAVAVVVDQWQIIIPRALTNATLNLPSVSMRPGSQLWVQWVYINGFPVTTLRSPTAVGDTSITVVDATGIVVGNTVLTIEDGKNLEQVIPSAVLGTTLTVAPLQFAHLAGTGVTDLPDGVKAAAMELISRLRDRWSLNMNAISMDGSGAKKPGGGPTYALCDPAVMLLPYRRVW